MQKPMKVTASLWAVCILALGSAFAAASGEKAEVKGMITTRTGETLIVKASSGDVTVVLTDSTRTKDNTGLFGWGKEEMSNVVLIPGLKVDVDGVSDEQGRVVAHTITVDGDDLETSEMIQAGLHPTAQQVAENMKKLDAHDAALAAHTAELEGQKAKLDTHEQSLAAHEQNIQKNMQDIETHTNRFMALSEYDVKAEATVKFNVGSSKISKQDEEQLMQLAQSASGMKGYIVEVVGYADSTGGAVMNTKLSENRAKAVITYLFQQGNVPMRHIVAPGAMGEYGAVAPNETKDGRAENRRVVVKVLVNKGVAGS
jgi:OmpA-OmpF porin, OOP family